MIKGDPIKIMLDKLKRGPTILTLSLMLSIMKHLQIIPEDEIIKNGDYFLEILDILVGSYSDSGIFEVDEQSKLLLGNFNDWLRQLGTKHPIGKNNDNLLAYINSFSTTM